MKITEPAYISIDLDRLHIARRFRNGWQIARKDDRGVYRTIDEWEGNRHSIEIHLERHGIHPTREAERQLTALPEQPAFRDDPPKRGQMPTLAV